MKLDKKQRIRASANFATYLLAVFFASAVVVINSCDMLSQKEQIYRRDELFMGTIVSIQLVDKNPDHARNLIDGVLAIMKNLSHEMNSHVPDSEVSTLNRKACNSPISVSTDIISVLKTSMRISELTDGAFDVTVGPLLKLWPIYKANNFRVPNRDELVRALSLVGWRNIEIDEKNHTVFFKKKGMQIDLGGIAKGYIVDSAISFLKKYGVKGALINAGGDIYALGSAPDGKAWRIGIQHPRNSKQFMAILEVKNKAIVTSGDYERFIIKNGIRYTHIVDPRTGFTTQKTASVTLIGDNTAFIDGLATAMMVLGEKEGFKTLSNIKRTEGLFVSEKPSGKLSYRWTPGFTNYVVWSSFTSSNHRKATEKVHSSIH